MIHRCFIALLLVVLRPALAEPPLAKYEPVRGCYIGAFVEHDPSSLGDFAAWEKVVGKKHASYLTYSGYGRPFPSAWFSRVKAAGAAAHLGWEPNNGLDAVQDDVYLRQWAKAAKATGIPIFLRFASEMNGNWMAYSGDPVKYIEKWRLVTRVMREEAPNVVMVWCVSSEPQDKILAYWPGDAWVDWVGVNIYSLVYHNNDPNRPASHKDPRDDLRFVYDRFSDRKPIMICEYAATSFCKVVNKPTVEFAVAKMTHLYQSLPIEFPRVKGIFWFSLDAIARGLANNNYCLTWDPRLVERYRAVTEPDYFLSNVILRGDSSGTAAAPTEPMPGESSPPVTDEPVSSAAAGPPEPDEELTEPRPEFGLAGLRAGRRMAGKAMLTAYHPPEWKVRYISFLIDGKSVLVTNTPPFRHVWDTNEFADGTHELSIRLQLSDGESIVSAPIAVEVRNGS